MILFVRLILIKLRLIVLGDFLKLFFCVGGRRKSPSQNRSELNDKIRRLTMNSRSNSGKVFSALNMLEIEGGDRGVSVSVSVGGGEV